MNSTFDHKVEGRTSGSRTIRAFISARMSSSRFPGKMLAPFRGEPLIVHVIRAVEKAVEAESLLVATSTHASDDPLATYLASIGIAVFRGPLEDVFERFRACARAFPCTWILRVTGDSPLTNPKILRRVIGSARLDNCDLVTTTFPRTFPVGQNAELIRMEALMNIDDRELTPEDKEHVTRFFYRHPERFRVVSVESGDPHLAEMSLAIDTVDDLLRLGVLSHKELEDLANLATSHWEGGGV
ncbi:MAG: NTP transferase domain-containing protein [Thermodesulfobacteriota bacterium]